MEDTPDDNPVDRLALDVARGLSLRRSAMQAEIPYTTARRRAADPEFRKQVEALRREMIGQALGKLTGRASRAAAVLGELLKHPDAGIRLKSARAILSDLMAIETHKELSERLAVLEAKLEATNAHPFTR